MAAKNVTVIPATINQRTHKRTETQTRRKVAGYARVSTDSDEHRLRLFALQWKRSATL